MTDLSSSSLSPYPQDGCPDWAHNIILTIRDLEIQLGNLLPDPDLDLKEGLEDSSEARQGGSAAEQRENPLSKGFWQVSLDSIAQRLENQELSESAVEEAFHRVSRDLSQLGFTPETIANFINTRLTGRGRLKYCNAIEVAAILNSRDE